MKHNDLLRLREKIFIARDELRDAIVKADVPCPSDDLRYAIQAESAGELIGVRFKQLDASLSMLLNDIECVMPYPVKMWAPENQETVMGWDVTCIDVGGEDELMCQFFNDLINANDWAQEQLNDGYCESVRIEAVTKKLRCVWRLSTNEL